MRYLYDYHMHSTNSIDGRNSVMELCESAVDKGLSEIAITDHFEPMSGNENCRQYSPERYFIEVEKARERFDGKIRVKTGVELGQPHNFKETTSRLLDSYSYDYILASLHKLADGRDFYEMDYSTIKLDDLCEVYLKELEQLASWGRFDCIGHLDIIKRYATDFYKSRITLISKFELLKRVFKIIIPMGKGIEINTSGLRQAPKETMPGLDVLKLYRNMGGEILTVGSDAHSAEDQGKGLNEAMELAAEAGFRYITVFDSRKPSFVRISEKPAVHSIDKKLNIA